LNLAQADKVDEIIQINPNLSVETTGALIDLANDYHMTYRYTADLLGTQLTNHEITTIAGTPIIEVKHTRLDGWGRILKRIFDVVASFILILLLSPIMLLTTLAIVFDSGRPIFFSYRRMGQYGKPFFYFKFRSMFKDAHQQRFDPEFLARQHNTREGSPILKFKDDPRITRVGRFIRRFSLDELPELFLVLIGAMSLVGPRPHELEEVDRYQKHHKKLLSIKPGITGLAQVSGRSDLNFEEEVKLDVFYMENWSLMLDLRILFKTPWAVLRPRTTL
jgi:exopolysaccharide biosynthesis polyprenyl glycosylphosphotransferase